jgi:hypothetical protein
LTTSTKGLASAWAKYRRGREHAVAFRKAIVAFLHAHPQPTFAIEFEDTTEEGVDRVCWLVVEHGYPEPPDELALLLGDAIHGYRCALDHLAWQLVAAAGTSLTEHEEKGVQFPVYKTETDFDKKASRTRMPGVAPAALAVIKKAQGYPLSSPPPSVHTLQKLSNDDKHRTIHLVAAAMWKAKVDFQCTGCRPVGYLPPPTIPGLRPGTRIAGMKLVYATASPTVTLNVSPTPAVFLEDAREATAVLGDIDDEVRALLGEAAIVAAAS